MTANQAPDTSTRQAEPALPVATPESQSVLARPRRRRLRTLLLTLLSLALLSAASLYALARSDSGTRWLLQGMSQLISRLTPAQISLTQIEGNLLDGLQVQSLHYRDQELALDARQLQLKIRWSALWQAHLSLPELRLAQLSLQQLQASRSHSAPLQHLAPPLRLSLEQLQLGQLRWQGWQQPAQILVTQAHGQLFYQHDWRWQLAGESQQVEWQTKGQLGASAPFAIQASLNADISRVLPELAVAARHSAKPSPAAGFNLQSEWQGSLAQLQGKLQLHTAQRQELLQAKLELHQVLEFSEQALAKHLSHFELNWHGINPAEFAAHLPHAQLAGSLQVKPQDLAANSSASAAHGKAKPDPKLAANTLNLQLRLENHQPQSWDKQGLPLQSIHLTGQLTSQQSHPEANQISAQTLAIQEAQIQFAGQGRLSAKGRLGWQAQGLQTLELLTQLSNLNLHALDSRLQTTQIVGQVELQQQAPKTATSSAALAPITLQAQLRDHGAELSALAEYQLASQKLLLKQASLTAQQARVEASAELELTQVQRFQVQGKLAHFDPARWLKMPAGDISASWQGSGQLQAAQVAPQTAQTTLDHRKSASAATTSRQRHWQFSLSQLQGHLAGASLSGHAEVQQIGDGALEIRQAQLDWGNNHLQLQADLPLKLALPRQLQVQLQARQLQLLDQVSSALNLPYRIEGEFDLSIDHKLDAAAAKAAVQSRWQMQARQLQLRWPGHSLSLQQAQAQADLQFNPALAQQANLMAAHSANWQASMQGKNWRWQQSDGPAWIQQVGQLQQVDWQVRGQAERHQISLHQRWQNQTELQLTLQAGFQHLLDNQAAEWQAELSALDLDLSAAARMPAKFGLTSTAQLKWAANSFSLQQLNWAGPWLKLQLEQVNLDQQGLRSRGQLQDLQPLAWYHYLQKPGLLAGDLHLSSDWQLDWRPATSAPARQSEQAASLQINLKRQRGDLSLQDEEGGRLPLALGLQQLQLSAGLTGSQLQWQAQAEGKRLGRWQADGRLNLGNDLTKPDWPNLPLQARLQAEVADLQWLGPILNPGLLLKGRLQTKADLSGNLSQPRYQAQMQGRDLQIAFAAEGLSLANGELDLNLEQNKLKVQRLQFNQAILAAPNHPRLRDWQSAGQSGSLTAQGEVDIAQERGSIRAEMKQFPLLQSKDRYLVVSGQAEIQEAQQVWALVGKLQADAAYFKLPKMPAPSLSSDIVIKQSQRETAPKNKHVVKTRLDFNFDLGPRFVFVGRGLDTGLSGSLRLRGQDGAPLQASGSIRTEGGNYEAYGQKLEIARGILNFQDSPANPALNVLALRRGQAVEAGVEISGTVAKPKVSLYSEPSVPDAEKLSWLVLGRGSEQLAAGDASLLMSAAGAIFGGEGQRNIPKQIVNGLGFDDFSIGASSAQASRMPSQTVAGSTGNHSSSSDQVLSLGKRLSPDLVLSVERGLADASGALKLSWQLTRRISINARTGNESALDVNYTFAFH